MIWFVLGPKGLREGPGGLWEAHGGPWRDLPGASGVSVAGPNKFKNPTFCRARFSGADDMAVERV